MTEQSDAWMMKGQLLALLNKLPDLTVMVVGDFMLDEYLFGDVSRISPEAPVPVVAVQHESCLPGGAGNVARNLLDLGVKVIACGVLGDDRAGQEVRRQLFDLGADVDAIAVSGEVRTTAKTRIMARSQHVVRVDRDCSAPVPDVLRETVLRNILDRLPECNGLLISDYSKGLLSTAFTSAVIKGARHANLTTVADPKPSNIEYFRGATVVTPNAGEAALASGIPCGTTQGLRAAAVHLLEWLELQAVLVTRGEHGMYLRQADGQEYHLEALSTQVYDVTGAGDTVTAVMTSALSAGAALTEAMILANLAASRVVQHLGCATVTVPELVQMLDEREAAE